MKGNFADAHVRTAMQDILKRLHFLDVEERSQMIAGRPPEHPSDKADLLSQLSTSALERISQMERSGDIDFDALPASDQRELSRLLASTASDSITPWQPWWHAPGVSQIQVNDHGQSLISPFTSGPDHEDPSDTVDCTGSSLAADPPCPPDHAIPKLAAITSAIPHPQLHLSVLQTIFAYCTAMCLYNGDPEGDQPGYVSTMWQLAPNLWQTTTASSLPATFSAAIHDSMHRLREEAADETAGRSVSVPEFGRWAWMSVASICAAGRGAAVCAMADVLRQHQAAIRELRSNSDRSQAEMAKRTGTVFGRTLKASIQKAKFQLTFVNACRNESYTFWANEIRGIVEQIQQRSNELSSNNIHRMLLVDPCQRVTSA